MLGQPARFNVCMANGECIAVKVESPVLIEGVRIDLTPELAHSLADALHGAADEAENEEQFATWNDNFNLPKVRSRRRSG